MKKIILYLIMATSILGAQLVDGYYVAQEAEYYWDGYVSEDKKYNEQMLAETGTNMKMFSVEAPQNFMDSLKERDGAGGASMENVDFQLPYIDTIAGATSASKKFRKMMKFLVKKAESGKTGKHKIKL
jgi:major membrane immunogen (membrane-anchored lipoprotein)